MTVTNPDLFADLLDQHMRRIRASASAVAIEIGMSREAVNNWRRGHSKPSKKHRDKVVACANYLRLSEQECNEFLTAVGFDNEYAPDHHNYQPIYQAVFDRLEQAKPYPILMVLSQAHLDQPPQKQLILEMAKSRFPKHRNLHVQLPYAQSVSLADFFQFLGSQLQLPEVRDELSFEFALNHVLQQQPTTLIISRFEQGRVDCREKLAGILRNLSEMYPNQLQLILCGAEHLSALKYAQGDLSLLNIADSMLLEFDPVTWFNNHLPQHHDATQQAKTIAQAEAVIGTHPALASQICQSLHTTGSIDYQALIDHSDMLYCDFNQVLQAADLVTCQHHLSQQQLGNYRPYLQDDALRKLFWLNLIRRDPQGQLLWQSEAIRQFGLQLLAERSA